MTANARRAATGKDRAASPARELYAVDACKAPRCGNAGIRWVATAKTHPGTGKRVGTGKPIPLDAGRDPDGPIVLDQDHTTRAWTARPWEPSDDPNRPRYSVHWTSCHEPGMYQATKAAADPMGVLPGIPGPRRAADTSGPCARCRTRFLGRYGAPGDTQPCSPLCPACLTDTRASWGPAFRRAQGLPE